MTVPTRTRTAIGIAVVFGVAVPGTHAAAQDPPTVRTVHVSAVNSDGAPVTDLGPADFEVKEDGKTRNVFNAQLAHARLHVALLVDDNGPGINDVRRGLAAFMQRLYQEAEIALVTTAGQNVTLVDYTSSPSDLQSGILKLLGRPAPLGGHVIDGIHEAAEALRRREGDRRAIVVISFESEEFSDTPDDRLLNRLRDSGAVLHVILIGRPVLRTMNPLTDGPQGNPVDTNLSRGRVLIEGSKRSGGRYEQMVVTAGLPAVMAGIADELANQYVLSYLLPAGVNPSERLEVKVKRSRVTHRSPTRIPASWELSAAAPPAGPSALHSGEVSSMQIMLLFALAVALVAVLFALQNIVPVTVSFLTWTFEGSLALVLFIALVAGAVVSLAASTPSMVRSRRAMNRLRKRVAEVESELAAAQRQLLGQEHARLPEYSLPPQPPVAAPQSVDD